MICKLPTLELGVGTCDLHHHFSYWGLGQKTTWILPMYIYKSLWTASDMTGHRLIKRTLLGFLILLMNGHIFSIILSLQGKYGNRLSSATGPFTTDGYQGLLSHDHRGFTADGHRERFRSLQERQPCILHGNVCNGTFAETSHATFRSHSTQVSFVDVDKEV